MSRYIGYEIAHIDNRIYCIESCRERETDTLRRQVLTLQITQYKNMRNGLQSLVALDAA